MAVAALAFTACNDDGRTLRPARPDQNASVSTLAPPTTAGASVATVDPLFGDVQFDLPDTAPVDSLTVDSLPVDSLPAESLPAGTAVLTAAFPDGGAVDPRFTCDGIGTSPPLRWTSAPMGTAEIAITITDDDAPGFVHWAIAGIDPFVTSIEEGKVPGGAIQGLNSNGTAGYFGPCPPARSVHTYRFTVHFLAQPIELSDGSIGADLIAAIEGSTFDFATVIATYRRD